VVVNNVEVARDGDTFCPIGDNRLAFFSKSEKQLSAALPAGWDSSVAALALSESGSEPADVTLRDGKITVKVGAGRPVMVFRDASEAKRWLKLN
jgi:hypothetical protein